jgi:3-phosphoshikimate 1-carboxyvinyltransferase
VFHTYDDHRLATAGAVLGLVVPGVEVEDVATTAKTFPGFADVWAAMVAREAG